MPKITVKSPNNRILLITSRAPSVPLFKPRKKSKQSKFNPMNGYTPPLLF